MSNRLKIGISQGDTNGVGWEIILKIFSDNRLVELFTPIIYGSPVAAAHYQKVVVEQGYVYRKLVITLNKLHRAVQRVHQQKQLPITAFVVEHLATLLTQHRDTRCAEVLLYGLVRYSVGDGYGCFVAFQADVVVILMFVNLHYFSTCLDRSIDTLRQEVLFDLRFHIVVCHSLMIARLVSL